MDLGHLQNTLQTFIDQRGWGSFQTPKNLVMALMVEAAELQEIFQWLSPEESFEVPQDPARFEHVQEEVADVFLYLLHLCSQLNIDLEQAAWSKIEKNSLKYPLPQDPPS